ncbi:MAG: PorT family protein, partial [Bacteroidia bacterium]|nr:PorT family protein [Bacteroidia bacterium]
IKVTYPRIMQSVSASVAYQFRPRWSVDAGVRFLGSESGLVELGILPEASQEPVGEIVIAESRLESKETYRFSQRQLEIPVHVNLHLKSQGRHQLVLSAGPSLNANLVASDYFSSREAESALAREGDFPSYQSWNYHMDYGFRYEYFLGSHMKLHAGPQFKQQLTAAFSGRSAPEQMRFRLGLQAGLSWNLNR